MLVLLTNQRHHYRDTGGYLAACARRDGSVTCHECHAAAAGRVCLVTVSLRSLADLPADTVTPLASCPAPGRGTPHFMLNTFNFPPNCPSTSTSPAPGSAAWMLRKLAAELSGDEMKAGASGWWLGQQRDDLRWWRRK